MLRNVERRYRESTSDAVRVTLEEFMVEQPCQTCGGKRLKAESLAVLVNGRSIGDVVDLPVERALEFFEGVPLRSQRPPGLDPEIAGPILKEVGDRLRFLRDVGLDYLTLGRGATSLSGGETQRIRLATQIGSRLVGVLYILDEPSVGLHQRDNERLLGTLRGLRDLGNTVIVVEHDADTIRGLRPRDRPRAPARAGSGARWWPRAPWRTSGEHPTSLTGRYLRAELRVPVPPGAPPGGARPPAPGRRRAGQQPAEPHGGRPAGAVRGGHRRVRLRQVHPGDRYPLSVAGASLLPRQGDPRCPHPDRGARPDRQGHRHRSEPDRPHAPLEPGDLHRAVHPDPGAVHPAARRQAPRATDPAASPST